MGCAASTPTPDLKGVDPTPDVGPIQRPRVGAGAQAVAEAQVAARAQATAEAPAAVEAHNTDPLRTALRPLHFGPEALLASVESGAIAPLRGSWLVDWEARGGRVQRRQDLPPEAFFPAKKLRRLVKALGDDYGLLFVGLS